MNTFLLIVATPDGKRFCEQAYMLSVRGSEGDLAILAGHIPFMTAVKAGDCKIELPDGEEKYATIGGGLLTVTAENTTLLTDTFAWQE